MKSHVIANLATFEVAAKLGSFTQAAKQLHITTGAVSQQMRVLEQSLGLTLFERHSRGVALTAVGQQLLIAVQQGLNEIRQTIAKLQAEQTKQGEIRIKLTPSFAYKWLAPRLERFYQQFPEISILIFADGALVDHQDNQFDLLIDYGQFPYRHHDAQLLMPEYLVPVMSLSYLQRFDWASLQATERNRDWQQVTLLHDAMPWDDAKRDVEWHYWFSQQQLHIASNHGHFFNRTDMAMAAAEAGLGVAMARKALIADDIANHRLYAPLPEVAANAGYYLLQKRSSTSIECFKQWLLEQCQIMCKGECGNNVS